MKRRLFNLLVILCLALFVAVCVLWVRSRSGWDRMGLVYCRYRADRSIDNDEWVLTSNRSGIALLIMHGHAPPRSPDLVRGYDINADNTRGRPRVWSNHAAYGGLENWEWALTSNARRRSPVRVDAFTRQRPNDDDDSWGVTITFSHWLLALLPMLPPALWLRRFRKDRRVRRLGLCRNCGYDLRASEERCPECGAAITMASHP